MLQCVVQQPIQMIPRISFLFIIIITECICYLPQFEERYTAMNVPFEAHHHQGPPSEIETKPMFRDQNHEIINERPYAIYMHHQECPEEALRDALHMIYPHRIEHSETLNAVHREHRETKWAERRHLYVMLTPGRVHDIHSHPCVERVVPLYYEEDGHQWNIQKNLKPEDSPFYGWDI